MSILVLLHFTAILSTVLAAGNLYFPASPVAFEASKPFRPYLFATFLQNPYRFYAPNPGPIPTIWYRCEYEDGTVRWGVLPDRDKFVIRMSYQRHLSLSMLLAGNIVTLPDASGYRVPPDIVKIGMASYVRHIAQLESRLGNPVSSVTMYIVDHALLAPHMVREGVDANDHRLYFAPAGMCTYAGEYDAKGTRKPDLPGTTRVHPFATMRTDVYWSVGFEHFLAYKILDEDVYPAIVRNPEKRKEEVVAELGLPPPIAAFLKKHTDLLAPPSSVTKEQPWMTGTQKEALIKKVTEHNPPLPQQRRPVLQ